MRVVELEQESDLNWIEALSRCSRVGLDVVLVTVLSTSGSTPRDRSAKMVVSVDSVYDSIGGGQLEYLAISHARERLLAQENEPEIKKFPLAAAALQCCGGSMTLLFESVFSNEHRLVLFGAGHVGSRVASMLLDTPIRTTLVDSRPQWLEKSAADEKFELSKEALIPEAVRKLLRCGDLVLIMTHDHVLDYEIVRAVLNIKGVSYIGLIGSITKWKNFSRRLKRDGFVSDDLDRVTCPIGHKLQNLKQPSAVAAVIVAEIFSEVDRSMSQASQKSEEISLNPSLLSEHS
jgi:xanthine dehydrogenase accessory factor